MKWLPHYQLTLISFVMIILGMLEWRALSSIGMITLICCAVINLRIRENWQRFWENKALLSLTLVFFLFLLGGLYSEDSAVWLDKMQRKIPFLTMPLAFAAILPLPRKVYERLLSFLVMVVFISAVFILMGYWQDYVHLTQIYQQGSVMPTPHGDHIRFSLMGAYAIVIGAMLYKRSFYWFFPAEKYIWLVSSILLFVFLHILAVRSGLLAIYAVIFFLSIRHIIVKQQAIKGLALLVAGGGFIMMAAFCFPTLKNKIGYTKYSFEQLAKQEDLAKLSDSKRLISIAAGFSVGNTHPVWGVGVGDINTSLDSFYAQHYPMFYQMGLMPHNQWVYIYAISGIAGLIIFMFAILFPLWWQHAYHKTTLVLFYIIQGTAFLSETPLEGQIGTAFFLFFVLLELNQTQLWVKPMLLPLPKPASLREIWEGLTHTFRRSVSQ